MLKQQTDSTLDAPARPHVLRVVEIKKSGVALLEGSDADRIEEQQKNIAHYLLPILDTKLYAERFYRVLHYIAEFAEGGTGPPKWWCVMHATTVTTSGVWMSHYCGYQRRLGSALGIQVWPTPNLLLELGRFSVMSPSTINGLEKSP